MEVPGLIKEHPWATGAAVLVLVFFMRSSGGAADNGAAITLQSQKIASDTNVALAGINANERVARAGYAAEMYKTGASLAATNTGSYLAMVSHTLDTSTAADVARHQTDTGARVALAGITAQTQALKDTINAKQAALETSLNHSDWQLGATLADYDRNLPALLAHADTVATLNSQAARDIANAKAQAIRANSDQSWIGTVADVASSGAGQSLLSTVTDFIGGLF